MTRMTPTKRRRAIGALAATCAFALTAVATAGPSTSCGAPAPRGECRDVCRTTDIVGDVLHAVDRIVGVECGHGVRHGRRGHVRRPHGVPACAVYVPGRWTWTTERYCVRPATTRREWVPPVTGWGRDACGYRVRVVVRSGYWKTVHVPARYETRPKRTWIEATWSSCGQARCGSCDAAGRHADGRDRHRGRGRGHRRGH